MDTFSNLNGMKILLIANSKFTKDKLKSSILDMGLVARIAGSAQEALYLLETNCFDIIICDYKLPDMTGLDFFKHVLNSCRNVVKILISASGDDEIVSRAYGIGIHDFLQKPFSLKTILATMTLHIRKQIRQPSRANIEPLMAA
jgi:DNA-binding response OmpR family regulator